MYAQTKEERMLELERLMDTLDDKLLANPLDAVANRKYMEAHREWLALKQS